MIVTFYSQGTGVSHSAALAEVAAHLADWGYSVLCVDWDLAGTTLRRRFGLDGRKWPERGLQDLVIDHVRGLDTPAAEYVERVALPNSSELDVLAVGNGRLAYAGHRDWDYLYQDDGLAFYLDECFEEWRRGYDLVLINGARSPDPSRGIYLAHLPDAVVIAFAVPEADTVAGTLRMVEETRDRLPFGRGRLIAVPLPMGEYEARLDGSLGPWIRAWSARDLPTRDALAALTAGRQDEPPSYALLAALLALGFAGTSLIGHHIDGYIAAAARTDRRAPRLGRFVVRGQPYGTHRDPDKDRRWELPDDLHRLLGVAAKLIVLHREGRLEVVLSNVDPFGPVPVGVSTGADDSWPAAFIAFEASYFAELPWTGNPPEQLYLDLAPTPESEPPAEGLVEAARAIRPYLPNLLGDAAEQFDGELVRLLGALPWSLPELRGVLTTDDLVAMWVDELLEDPLYRPYDLQPRRAGGAHPTRYTCPVDGNFVWYQRDNEPIPNCPDHDEPLIPAPDR